MIESGSSVPIWLKGAEEGTDVIVRLLEVEGRPDSVVFASTGERQAISPYEILTLRQGRDGRWRQSDGVESEQQSPP